jgi:hypothetical protein
MQCQETSQPMFGQQPDMKVLDQSELLALSGEALGLGRTGDPSELVKPALRRAAFLLAPCSPTDLINFVSEPMSAFREMKDEVESALAELIAYGDILEMKRLESDPWDAAPYVLRPAPPAFILRSSGDAIIVGVSGDFPSPLTAELDAQLRVEGPVRVLRSAIDSLASHLKLLGLTQLSEHAWLRTPSICPFEEFLNLWHVRLHQQPKSVGTIDGLEILERPGNASYYLRRWVVPEARHTGSFVSRRSQQYGAKLWSLVEMEQGVPTKVLDLHADDDWQRPCDLAWRLQAAIDASTGAPLTFRVYRSGTDAFFDFSFPLPAFAERRLALVARKTKSAGGLFRLEMPSAHAQTEIAALMAALWLQPIYEGAE